jgi:hypothetical protein
MTRTEHIQAALVSALARHAVALDAGVGVTNLHCEIKFDRSTGLPTKAIVNLEMENFIVARSGTFTFLGE